MSTNIAVARREFLWLLIALTIGLLLLPPLVWLVGSRVFGPYAGGNGRDLVDHFFSGLAQGQPALWVIALGPYVAILVLRATLTATRATKRQA